MFNNNHDFQIMGNEQSRGFMQRVYAWMTTGLAVSAATAYLVASTPALVHTLSSSLLVSLALFGAQIGLIYYIQARIATMTTGAAVTAYLSFTALLGVTLSSLMLVYTMPSLGVTLLVTAGMFGAMAVYGYFTQSDLSSLGDFLFMGLIGLVIANFAGFFIKSANFSLMTAAFGVIIFTLFTAYDVQQIKRAGQSMLANNHDMFKVSLIGALKLYLDFVNLFLYLLRFFGQKRND